MRSSSNDRFLYWRTDKGDFLAGEVFDGGLDGDISAYAHISNDILVTYHGNGATYNGSSTFEDTAGKLSNELYLANVKDSAAMLRTSTDYVLCSNMFDPITDDKQLHRYRLAGWKKDNVGEAHSVQQNIKLD